MRAHHGMRTGLAIAAILTVATPASATATFSTTPTLISLGSQTLNTFDISTFNPATGLFYLGDRTNAGISAWNLNSNSFIGTIGAGQFTGATGNNATSGADGTAVFTTNPASGTPVTLVLGGDGNSTVKAYSISGSGTSLGNYSSNPVYTVNTGLPGIPANSVGSGPGNNRADEMAYDPVHNNVLVANNAGQPVPFTTLFNASTGAVISQVLFNGANNTPNATGNSIEASTYDPAKDVFWLAIPQIGPSASDPGGLSEVNAATGAVIATFGFPVGACSPTGVAITGNTVAVGCSATDSQTLLFDTNTHAFTSLPYSGSDAVTYDAAINAFLLSGANYTVGNSPTGAADPSFAIIDAGTDTISQIIATSIGNDHSIDGGNGIIGVPFTGGPLSQCVNGCLAVFTEVAEPGTLPIMLTAMAGLVGFGVVRQRWCMCGRPLGCKGSAA